MHKEENEWTQATMQALLRILAGAAAALGVSLLILMAASFGMSAGWVREGLMGQITVAACVIGSFMGGCLAVRGDSGGSLVHGLLVGGFLFAIMLLIGTLFYGVTGLEKEAVALIAACLCGGALSGILFGKGKKKAKAKRGGEGRSKKRRR